MEFLGWVRGLEISGGRGDDRDRWQMVTDRKRLEQAQQVGLVCVCGEGNPDYPPN